MRTLILGTLSGLLIWSLAATAKDPDPKVQTSECFAPVGMPAGAPISLVYMHGMFQRTADGGVPGDTYYDLEMRNRKELRALAQKLGIRIAVPTSPKICPMQKMRCWSDKSAADIKKLAQDACDGAPFASDVALFAFSVASTWVDRASAKDCGTFKSFDTVLSIGAYPTTPVPQCDKRFFTESRPHVFPTVNWLAKHFAALAPAPASVAPMPLPSFRRPPADEEAPAASEAPVVD